MRVDLLVVVASIEGDSSIDGLDLQGELIGSELGYPPGLTTVRARPDEVLVAGLTSNGDYTCSIRHD